MFAIKAISNLHSISLMKLKKCIILTRTKQKAMLYHRKYRSNMPHAQERLDHIVHNSISIKQENGSRH